MVPLTYVCLCVVILTASCLLKSPSFPVLPVPSQVRPFLLFSSVTRPGPSLGVSWLDCRGISVSWPASQHPRLLPSGLLTLSRCVLFKGEAYLVVMLFYQNWPPTVLTRKIKILRPCVVCLCLAHASVTSSPCQSCSHAGFLPGPQIHQLHSNPRPSDTLPLAPNHSSDCDSNVSPSELSLLSRLGYVLHLMLLRIAPPTFPFFTAFIYTLGYLSFPFLLWLLLLPGRACFSYWGIYHTCQPLTAPSS